jgi:hypothetical protein
LIKKQDLKKKKMRTTLLITIAAITGLSMFVACGQRNAKPETITNEVVDSIPKVKLTMDLPKKTFKFIDVASGDSVAYDKLIIRDKEILKASCLGKYANPYKVNCVIFYYELPKDLKKEGSVKVNSIIISENKEMNYQLEEKTLTILE